MKPITLSQKSSTMVLDGNTLILDAYYHIQLYLYGNPEYLGGTKSRLILQKAWYNNCTVLKTW